MPERFPLLPIALNVVVRVLAGVAAPFAQGFKTLARAHRNRREARKLAGLDRHMLADIGITRADVSDAFSQPFWQDPTVLLNERAKARRHQRFAPRHGKCGLSAAAATPGARPVFWI